MCASMNKWWDWQHWGQVVGLGPGNIGEEKGADECAERRIRSRRKVEQEKKDECEKVAVTGREGSGYLLHRLYRFCGGLLSTPSLL